MSQKLHRRTLLQCIAAAAASTAFGCSDEETTPTQAGSDFFPQSLASGDPRPDSVVLWTRAVDPASPDADTALKLQVSTSDSFGTLVLDKEFSALAANDHALKVKVTNLSARTTYYYRFSFTKDGQTYTTNVGRTRTAPAATDDVPVKFAFASCQDYIGRYYNSWQRLLQLDADLDFVVFLGDYIYETTGDASFQSSSGGGRTVNFTDAAGALPQKTGFLQYAAAQSLSNYREIYKTIRTDRVLQQVHERYPFIVTWDDHEFSDDSWGATATYEDGKANERNEDRKRNAEQAFFEHIPLDTQASAEGAMDVTAVPRYPNTKIYRDFEFGKQLKLVVTDHRTFRPDHLIPEDAYPGSVVITEAQLAAAYGGTLPPTFATATFAYVNIDDAKYAQQKQVLQGAYQQQAIKAGVTDTLAAQKAGALIKGNQALAYINQVLSAVNKALVIDGTGASHGLAFLHLGKVDLFGIRGSRYVVVRDTFNAYSRGLYAATQGASENVFGTEQETWLRGTVKNDKTWNVVISSVSPTSMVWDLSNKTDIADTTLRQAFYFNVDQWDGFPNKKAEILKYMKDNVANPLFIAGDIHASFVSVEGGVPALTTPAISSGSIRELAATAVRGAGYTTESSIYKYAVANMDTSFKEANPSLVYSDTDAHGFVIVAIQGSEALASYHLIPSTEVGFDYSKRPSEALEAKAFRRDFLVKAGKITPQ